MRYLRLFLRANAFPFKVFVDYLRYSSRAELTMDMLLPVIVSAFLTYVIWSFKANNVGPAISQINNQTLTAVSILAGFNVASISVFAASDSKLLQNLRDKTSNKFPNITLFEMMLSFFAWAITSQLFIIFVGIVILFVTSFTATQPSFIRISVWEVYLFLWAWMSLIFHAIFVSVRNLKVIMVYLLNKDGHKS
jgi:hypothetical protein